jgi:hypothetical protein
MTSSNRTLAGAMSALVVVVFAMPHVAAGEPAQVNFVVEGTTEEAARLITEAAEKQRTEQAKLWLGKALPAWIAPCTIRVSLCEGRPSGGTTFDYRRSPHTACMFLNGPLPAILDGVLPHEVGHTVLAEHFRRPIPRWADEGAAILSETGGAPKLHQKRARELLANGRAMRLTHLFGLRDYPADVGPLYAEGYSVSRFLVEKKDRATYLKFITAGMTDGWESAVSSSYGYESIDALEQAWIASLRESAKAAAENKSGADGQ